MRFLFLGTLRMDPMLESDHADAPHSMLALRLCCAWAPHPGLAPIKQRIATGWTWP
jgi:hypothetical protein